MQKVLLLVTLCLLWTAATKPALAAKKRIFSTPANVTKTTVVANATAVTIKAGFRPDRKAIILNVTGLARTTGISYELTYIGSGIDQGVVGTIRPTEGSAGERTFLFGTCSHAVCTYHQNITDAKLVVTAKLTNGKTITKTFKIRV